MLILHAGMLDGELVLWAEDAAAQTDAVGQSRHEGARAATTIPPSPFDPGVERLADGVQESAVGFHLRQTKAQEMAVWMPSRDNAPLPSSALINKESATKKKVSIRAWKVSAYPLSTNEAVDLLCACMGKHTLARGVIVGHDLAFWVEAVRLAASLVASQNYLPDFSGSDERWLARWVPLMLGEDAERLTSLARRMPPVARACTAVTSAQAPAKPALAVLAETVTWFVDFLVRAAAPGGLRSENRHRFQSPSINSVHDLWFNALRAPHGVIETHKKAFEELAADIRTWRRPLAMSIHAPFRLCFKLEEPAGAKDTQVSEKQVAPQTWRVTYFLQSKDAKGDLIPVEKAWKHGVPHHAHFDTAALREWVLLSLGQAASMAPGILTGLEGEAPSGHVLDTADAHEFLIHTAPHLRHTGCTVILPEWWTGKGSRSRLGLRASIKGSQTPKQTPLTLDAKVKFEWSFGVGNRNLGLKELRALSELSSPLIRLDGQWVEFDENEIHTAIEFLCGKNKETASIRDLADLAIGATDAPEGFDFDCVQATGWIDTFLKDLQGHACSAKPKVPQRFNGELRPYQERGFAWLTFLRRYGLGACLADDMGLGKTIQALTLILDDWEARNASKAQTRAKSAEKKASAKNVRGEEPGRAKPVLLVCPTSLLGNWRKESSRFTPTLPVMIHHGSDRLREADFKAAALQNAIVITSYGLLHRDIDLIQGVEWAGVILDEAQNIKNPDTKQARAARGLQAEYRVVLTGTPIENSPADLWSIMEFLNPGLLGTREGFKTKYLAPIQLERDANAGRRLQRLTSPFILRRLKSDPKIISDLPKKLEIKTFCTLTKEQIKLYEAVQEDTEQALHSAEGIRRRGLVLAALTKLKQICNHPVLYLDDGTALSDRSGKLERLTEMVEVLLDVGDRALIFSQYAQMGHLLRSHLEETFGREVLFLHGGVPKRQRDQMIDRFQSDDGPPLFVLSLKAGGTGLNLTRANHVFHYDRWWNPAVENQATDRAFRIGQKCNVQVHKFIALGTLEERIDEMLGQKHEVAESIVGASEKWLTEMSNEQLKELITLRAI